MAKRIYTMNEHGELAPLEEQPFETENDLQRLIAEHPELLDGEQMRPDDPRRWILVTREKGIPEASGAGDRWAVDHLIIDQDAVPTLAEVKRGSNPEIRRAVVGQLLEYAAHAAQTWSADELRREFEVAADARGLDPDDELGKLLLTDSDLDADEFWARVATNLAARRLRLLVVADEIPDPLALVIEFLNAQMPMIEVLAVEIKQFHGESAQALVPRVIGRTAAPPKSGTPGQRRKLTRAEFLHELGSETARGVANRLFDAATEAGAVLSWGASAVIVRMRCRAWRQPVSVAWLHPPSVSGWMGMTNIAFGAAIFNYSPPPGEELRTILERWVDQFSNDDFAVAGRTSDPKVWTVEYDAAAECIDLIVERLVRVLTELKAL